MYLCVHSSHRKSCLGWKMVCQALAVAYSETIAWGPKMKPYGLEKAMGGDFGSDHPGP